jgi:hypothetical protein
MLLFSSLHQFLLSFSLLFEQLLRMWDMREEQSLIFMMSAKKEFILLE